SAWSATHATPCARTASLDRLGIPRSSGTAQLTGSSTFDGAAATGVGRFRGGSREGPWPAPCRSPAGPVRAYDDACRGPPGRSTRSPRSMPAAGVGLLLVLAATR